MNSVVGIQVFRFRSIQVQGFKLSRFSRFFRFSILQRRKGGVPQTREIIRKRNSLISIIRANFWL